MQLEPTPVAEPLDAYLREVVHTLHAAVTQGMRHAAESPRSAQPQIEDCQAILHEILAGNVGEWLS